MKENMKITKSPRTFVAENLVIDSWESIQNYFEELSNRILNSKEEYVKWLHDKSELEAVLEEDAAWRYIKMTIDTRDVNLSNAYTFFVTKIQPELAPFEDKLNKKLVDSPYFESLNKSNERIYRLDIK